MRTTTLVRFSAALLFLMTAYSAQLFGQNYQLVWSDEFSGPSIDPAKWVMETGAGGWGNNELEYYTNRTSNAYIDNGMLVIKAVKENYLGSYYTSARMKTQAKASWKYGKIEARMKLPYGQGIWPAFWMLGDNISTVSWPKCGEIDIMEMIGGTDPRDRTLYGTAHWDANGHASYGLHTALPSGKFADDFHLFSITWTAQKISWSLDGTQYCVIDITPAGLAAFQKNFFIILNLAVGGNWPGNPDLSTVFPQTMYVDYVRVYQDANLTPQVTLTAPVNGSSSPANADIVLSADATGGSGTVTKVEFYQDAMKLGESAAAPYTMTVQHVQSGTYRITAKVYNSLGDAAVSSPGVITVDGSAASSPYGVAAAVIPGTVEMENYDLGGAGIAYNDADAGNTGNAYRSDNVDIEACTDNGGGYNIGWTANDEWLAYTVEVKQSGLYRFTARTASSAGGGKFHIEIDGADVTGVLSVPSTGGWQTWAPVSSGSVPLQAGVHTMKFSINASGFNVNRIDASLLATSVAEHASVPGAFALAQNYPNPFNPSTTIQYSVAAAARVQLEVFDLLGSRVATLVDGSLEAGTYTAAWDARTLPGGVYFYRMQAGGFSETKRLILQK
jgi:beta-glucanase (GH16 family)